MIEDEIDFHSSDDDFDYDAHLRTIRRNVISGRSVDSEEKLVIKEHNPQEPKEPVPQDDDKIYIADMASRIGREEHTVRRWVRESEKVFGYAGDVPEDQGFLPRDLWPERETDGRKRMWWIVDQFDGLKEFAAMKESRKGWAGSKR